MKTVTSNLKKNSLQKYSTAQNYMSSTQSGSTFVPKQHSNLKPSPYSKALSKKTMVQIKLVGTSMIFHGKKLNLYNKGTLSIETH
jgi:tRNA(Phe) wybutosine-synthesizing methylase Tyw3